MALKKGPVTTAEGAVIREAVARQSDPSTIAAQLNRSEATISKWIRENLPRDVAKVAAPVGTDTASVKQDLQRSLKWQYLREELAADEIDYFQEQYATYIQQFGNDVLPSEQDQIFNLIKLDIAIHRNRRDTRIMREELRRLEDEFRTLPPARDREPADAMQAQVIENTMGGLRAAETARESQYLKMSDQLRQLQSDLKANRSQRINKIETFKESWVDVLKKLMDMDTNQLYGVAAEFNRKATEKEEARLSQWHQFEDGKLDQPVLTAESALPESDDNG